MENENKTFLPFTEEELKELNFTPEELETLEGASAYSETVDMLPDDPDAFIKKIEETFSDDDNEDTTLQKLTDLCKTDPDFVNQMIALQEVYGAVKLYPEEEDSEIEK